MWVYKNLPLFHVLVIATTFGGSKGEPLAHPAGIQLEVGGAPYLPAFLEGKPEDQQVGRHQTFHTRWTYSERHAHLPAKRWKLPRNFSHDSLTRRTWKLSFPSFLPRLHHTRAVNP